MLACPAPTRNLTSIFRSGHCVCSYLLFMDPHPSMDARKACFFSAWRLEYLMHHWMHDLRMFKVSFGASFNAHRQTDRCGIRYSWYFLGPCEVSACVFFTKAPWRDFRKAEREKTKELEKQKRLAQAEALRKEKEDKKKKQEATNPWQNGPYYVISARPREAVPACFN